MTTYAPWRRQAWSRVAHHVTVAGSTLCGIHPGPPGALGPWLPPVPGDQPGATGLCEHCAAVLAGRRLEVW